VKVISLLENSPALQPWDGGIQLRRVPQGKAENLFTTFLSSLSGLAGLFFAYPALKRWATVY
jgi:hypothetical protein